MSQAAADQEQPYQPEILTSMATEMVQIHRQLEKLESNNVQLRMEMEKKMEQLETKNAELIAQLNEVNQKSLNGAAFVMKCAAQYSWPTETTTNLGQNQTITYDHISAGV